jgi:hypothetical protein
MKARQTSQSSIFSSSVSGPKNILVVSFSVNGRKEPAALMIIVSSLLPPSTRVVAIEETNSAAS